MTSCLRAGGTGGNRDHPNSRRGRSVERCWTHAGSASCGQDSHVDVEDGGGRSQGVESGMERVEGDVSVQLSQESERGSAPRLFREVEARYVGQSHELALQLGSITSPEEVVGAFHAAHEERFGYRQPDWQVEVIALRVVAVVAEGPEVPEPTLPALREQGRSEVVLEGEWVVCPVLAPTECEDGGSLEREKAVWAGPALVAAQEFSVFLGPGWEMDAVPGALRMKVRRAVRSRGGRDCP